MTSFKLAIAWARMSCTPSWWSECAECGEETDSQQDEEARGESWCVVCPHLTDPFFHPSLLVVAFADKSERIAMASFSTVQLHFSQRNQIHLPEFCNHQIFSSVFQ